MHVDSLFAIKELKNWAQYAAAKLVGVVRRESMKVKKHGALQSTLSQTAIIVSEMLHFAMFLLSFQVIPRVFVVISRTSCPLI